MGLRDAWICAARIRGSPYVWAGATTLPFLVSFYITRGVFMFFRLLLEVMALIVLVQAYRTVGGVGWILWLAPILTELTFWPRLLLAVVFHYTFLYPLWDERALAYPALFTAGVLLSRRRYSAYLRSHLSYETAPGGLIPSKALKARVP